MEEVADADLVRTDAVLSEARDAATPYAQDRTPRLLDTFDQGAKVRAGQANLYERALTGYLQPRLLVALATQLRDGDGTTETGKPPAVKPSVDRSSPGSPGTEAVAPALKAGAEPVPGRAARKPGEAAPPAAPDLAEALRLYRMLGGEEASIGPSRRGACRACSPACTRRSARLPCGRASTGTSPSCSRAR